MKKYYIIGAGMGTKETLTHQAYEKIMDADNVLSTARLADGFAEMRDDIQVHSFSKLLDAALKCNGKTAILVSGDTGFYSAAKHLYCALNDNGNVQLIPGISSIQAFCAKLGTSYDDAQLISLHGRSASLLGAVSCYRKVIMLTGGESKAHKICKMLVNHGLQDIKISIGENIGAPNEYFISGTAAELAKHVFSDLCVLMTENENPADLSKPSRDVDFIRGNVPMTKQEIRWLACDLLSIKPSDIVYDIGAGTGSVSIDMAKRANLGRVFAVECKAEALDLIMQNRRKFGCFHVTAINAVAPDGLDALPIPDCVFIGGSRGNMMEIVQKVKDKNPSVRVVITAITLETLYQSTEVLEKNGFSVSISCINVSYAKKLAGYHMMTAQNPVYLIGGNL